MSHAPVDLAVFSRDRRPILVVEVMDSDLYSTVQGVVELRRNWLSHGVLPSVPYFMIAMPSRLFLWRGDADAAAYPEFSASAEAVFEAYGSGHQRGNGPILGGMPELVLFFWLANTVSGALPLSSDSEPDRMLLESGLYQQIRDGTVDFDVTL